MPLFTRRDRIAIAVFGVLILAGWGMRWHLHNPDPDNDIQLIRGAVQPPHLSATPDSVSTPALSPGALADSLRLDLNRATAVQLESLPGIGPAKAAAIIRWREDNGPFAQPADIMKVKGIGPKIYEGVKRYIIVRGETVKSEE
jgi:competence ComEA-like helix-hairpin-helix protein